MTRRPEIARSLAAALDDDRDLERRPARGVDADLEAFDVDPARSVALAKALAQRPDSPAARLLGRLAEDDDAAAEIEALTRAPIDEVRARVPVGTSAAVVAAARRRAGATTSIVGFGRRRLRVIGIGGSLVGLAAGLALVLLTSQDRAVAPSLLDAEQRMVAGQRPDRSAEPERETAAATAPAEAPATALRSESPRPGIATSAPEARSDEARFRSAQDQPVSGAVPAPAAFLLVEPGLAPERWRRLSLPDGRLDQRLTDARRVAAGRRIVALAGYGPAEERREVVIVLRRADGDVAVEETSRPGLPDVLEPVPDAFEMLPLD